MKISELAELTNLTPSRIRFYERIGLFNAVGRKANGYRNYPPEAATLLRLIATAQQVGFSLDELRVLLPSDLATWDHGALVAAIHQKINNIDEMRNRLAESKAQLQDVLDEIKAKPEGMDCPTNAKRVLSHFGMTEAVATDEEDNSSISHERNLPFLQEQLRYD